MRYLDCRVDYSIKTFGAVVHLCKDLGIRHPEELSFSKPLEQRDLKKNYVDQPKKKIPAVVEQNGHTKTEFLNPAPDTNSFIPTHANQLNGSNGSLDNTTNGGPFLCAPVSYTPNRQKQSTPISSPSGVSFF